MTFPSVLRACAIVAGCLVATAAHAAAVSLSGLIGARVTEAQGERLGTIRDLAVDVTAGTVRYAVLAKDATSRSGSELRALPFTALRPGLARDQLVLDAAARDARRTVPLGALRFPPAQQHAILTLAASQPALQPGVQSVPASLVIGGELVGAEGKALGTIDEVMFDARTGALQRVVAGELSYPARTLKPRGEGRFALPGASTPRPLKEPQWPAMRASVLLGREVVDRLHRDFGEIRDLVIDLERGRVRAARVDRRDDWSAGQALVTMPIEAFSLPRDLPEKLAINYTRERFQ